MRSPGRTREEYSNPFEVEKLVRASNDALARGDLLSVISYLTRAEKLAPRNPRVHSSLGNALLLCQRIAEAEAQFKAALSLNSTETAALAGLAEIRYASREFEEAEALLRAVVKVDTSNVRAHLILVDCLSSQNRFEEADVEARAVISAHPLESVPHSAYGTRLQQLGRFDEAETHFSLALELDPTDSLAHLGRAQQKKFSKGDRPLIQAMETAAEQSHLDWQAKANLLFGIGKAYDDLKEFERAMKFFVAANQIEDRALNVSRVFPRDEYIRSFTVLEELFTRDFIAAHRSPSDFSPKPIFIVGMMRSGTTLVEQILSAHPSVAAGGEIVFWKQKAFESIDFDRCSFDVNRALGARKRYNKRLRAIAPSARYVTDKMPDNYQALGVLSAMYPTARFIHCSRHPVDTCLSIFTTAFQQPPDYSSDLDKLVFIYELYRRLMAHWRSVLPANSLLEVRYEELIEDRERVTRQLIDFCQLEWDDSCLRFESNPRPVTTASLWQVRQPVYRTSVGRWRSYEPWLGPLSQLLEDHDSRKLE